ncbi:MAG TPA: hypothetical protein VF266_26925 [Thermoanaerobaculia bacterium]
MKLSRVFLSLTMVMACAAAAPEKPWSVTVKTSGGIAGRGIGAWTISSDGNVTMRRMNGEECTFALTDEELRTISRLMAAARPARWKESYVPENRCCDRIEYALELDVAGRISATRWLDGPPEAPKDLSELANAIAGGEKSIRAESAERCR